MITLFDIPSKVPGSAFSPNTFKTRLALSFKGLAFKTEWVELPDIEPKMKALGAEPTSTKPDGSPMYTLPVIHDDATGKYISESTKIAQYLDDTYPDKPSLYPFGGARAPIALFSEYVFDNAIKPAVLVYSLGILPHMYEKGVAYLRKTREPLLKTTLEEANPKGEERAAQLAASKAGFSKIATFYAANGEGKSYFYGDVPSYADVLVVSYLLWARTTMGKESSEWKVIEEWDGGRWKNLLFSMEKYCVL